MAFGHVGTVGQVYSRVELGNAGVHRNPRGGIQGSGVPGQGAESVLVTGRYEDDVDLGATIFYTGQGGQDPDTRLLHRPQVADQQWGGLNKALGDNVDSGQPVRVIHDDPAGYRYDGLYRVVGVADLRGISGHRIFRYELSQLATPAALGKPASKPKKGPAPRVPAQPVDRIVRDTKITRAIKALYDYTCQICQLRLVTKSGAGYAEGAHIEALGRGGPDDESNVLCLCPNHHTLLDFGGVYIDESTLVVHSTTGVTAATALTVHRSHAIDPVHLIAHRTRFGV